MELVAEKELTASKHFPYSAKFIGGEKENISICLFTLNYRVPSGFLFVCSIIVSVCSFY